MTARPPSRTAITAVWKVSGEPSASSATSTPRPAVAARMASTVSSRLAFTVWVAPSWTILLSFSSHTSTAITAAAPMPLATWIAAAPM
eukprot:CAMPEP_0114284220 /NCGR_PEP_ID=MMETSP0059-20121206/4535_1 /TAXON_ID=36894 /ORGANISM="Pyramimonas parkeae, Strain CCMP726" /LENGTH=87 /DNA_ID=CAMNT_0001405033 /DNA_START=660 /DNA_END=920 /DNA_ORIENTATION=-